MVKVWEANKKVSFNDDQMIHPAFFLDSRPNERDEIPVCDSLLQVLIKSNPRTAELRSSFLP